MNPRPSLHAIVVCDTIIEDRNTSKKSLIGTFTHLASTTVPCHDPSLRVSCCLTDIEDTYTFSRTRVHADHDKQIAIGTLPAMEITDRLQIVDYGIIMLRMPCLTPGRYDVRLFTHDAFIGNNDSIVIQPPQSRHIPLRQQQHTTVGREERRQSRLLYDNARI